MFMSVVKMNRRLATSVSVVMAGGRVRLFKAITGVLLESQKFNGFGHSCCSLQFQRFKSSKGLLVCNGDDFSELGPPVERAIGRLKLATLKPNSFLKLDNGRKVSSSKSPRIKSKQNIKDIFVALDKPHQTSCEFGNGDDASAASNATSDAATMSNATSDAATTNYQKSISVRNVPSTISHPQLVEAASVFGKVYTTAVRHLPDGLDCWDIQFESLESCNEAIKAGSLTVGSSCLPIHSLWAPMVVTIRIKGIFKDASLGEIHSICKLVGTTEGLAWVSKGDVDALFTVENDAESQLILKKLNGLIVGGHRLSASLSSINSSYASTSENENARCRMALQMSSYLTEIKNQLDDKRVLLADLFLLHEGMMHLADLPTTIDPPDI